MIYVTNTMTDEKEEFKPLEDRVVKMYVCGPTVYDHAHIGHARSAVVFDVIRRWFEYRGYRVIFVRNYTDVDDKIIKRANEEGIPWFKVAEKYIKSYEEDMEALNVKEPPHPEIAPPSL
jgi:cysteinyl-tRNA synthetase